jgi:hypothetical protein
MSFAKKSGLTPLFQVIDGWGNEAGPGDLFNLLGDNFTLDDFLQGDVRGAHPGFDLDERLSAQIQLFDPAGDQVDEQRRFDDHFGRFFN